MKRFCGLFVLAVACALLALWLTLPRLDAKVLQADGLWQPTSLPWRFDGKVENRHLRVDVLIRSGLLTSSNWRIIPDDELQGIAVNGQPVSLAAIRPELLRDWARGFRFDFGLQTGLNQVDFLLRNDGGPGGLLLQTYPGWPTLILLFLSGALLILALHTVLPLTLGQRLILLLALLPLLGYWGVTPWEARSHDVGGDGGHFAYVAWVADHLALPRPDAGWTFYHPPLYYVLGALALHVTDFLGLSRPECLQLFSLGLWLLFLVATAATLRCVLRGRHRALLLATVGLAFWPVGIIHSIRIGNDAAVYAVSGLLVYCLMVWWKTRSRKALMGIGVFCILALLSKTSALAVVATACALVGWRVLFPDRSGRWVALGQTVWVGCCALLGLLLGLASNVYYYWRGELSGWLVGNEGGLNGALRVPANFKAFIPLDIPTFLTTPWANPWTDESGRGNFWNYLLRSSLTGEFSFDGVWLPMLALVMGGALLVLCVLVIRSALRDGRGLMAYRLRPLYVLGLLWIASLIALRIKTPFSCSNDFRYVLPSLLPFLVFAVRSGFLARSLLLLLAACSALFFMVLS